MDTLSWVTLALAFATFVLAGMAFWSIQQNYGFRKREQKERLLNEIVEWAIGASKWRPMEIFRDMENIVDKLKLERKLYSHIVKIMENFIEMRSQNKYVSVVAINLDEGLGNAVSNLIDILESKIGLLDEWKSAIADAMAKGKPADDEQYFAEAEKRENRIEELALEVVEKATNVKLHSLA